MQSTHFIYRGYNYYVFKIITSMVFLWFVVRILWKIYSDFNDGYGINYINFIFLVSETITFLFVALSRPPKSANVTLKTSIFSGVATYYLLFISFSGTGSSTVAIAPLQICVILMLGGLLFQAISKIYLGRSFGILPANRGIVDGGPYRFVRHPIYFGYMLRGGPGF